MTMMVSLRKLWCPGVAPRHGAPLWLHRMCQWNPLALKLFLKRWPGGPELNPARLLRRTAGVDRRGTRWHCAHSTL